LNAIFEYSDFYNNGFLAPSGTSIYTFNPQFVDIANHDYHLQSSSQGIDVGTEDDAPDTDFDGVPRLLLGGVDLGIYEYGIWWNGNISHDWHMAGNWSNGQVPTLTNSVTIPLPTFYQYYPKVNNNASIQRIYLNHLSKLEINATAVLNVLE
jgi:hypothetical protein